MIGPINYSAQMVDPFQGLGEFAGLGQQIRQSRQQDAKQEQAEQAAEQYRADITAAMSNPSPTAFASLALKYPGQREAFKQGWEAISAEQQQSELKDAGRLAAALSSGRPDVAERLISERITAAKNSGLPAPELEMLMDSIKANPRQAYGQVLHLVSALPGGDKVLESLGKIGAEQRAQEQAPGALRKVNADATAAEADAVTKGVTAKYAEPQAIKDLELKGWNIKAIQEDIAYKKESNRIAAINSSLAKEGNSIRTQELQAKLDEAVAKRDEKVRERAAEGEQRVGGLVDARTLIREIKDLREAAFINPTGITAGAALMPGSNARSQSGKIEQLRNTLTLDFLDKLKGPTSDRDIAFLKNIAANLDLWQSDKRFAKELEKVDAALERADEAMRRKYGMPPAPKPSNPKPEAGQPTDGASVSGW